MASNSEYSMDEDHSPAAGSAPNGHSKLSGGPQQNGRLKHESDLSSSEDEDMPLSQATRRSETTTPRAGGSKRRKTPEYESSSDEDIPLASSSPVKSSATRSKPTKPRAPAATKANGASSAKTGKGKVKDELDSTPAKAARKTKQPAKKKVKAESEDVEMSSLSEDDAPLASKPKPKTSRKRKAQALSEDEAAESSADEKPVKAGKRQSKKVKKEEEVEVKDVKPMKKGARSTKTGDANGKSAAKKKEKEEQEQEEVYRWWEAQANGDGTEKWQTLEHNGVFFPPPYEPLPKRVKMKYNGKEVILPPASEEVAGFYAAMLETDHAQDTTFNKNFFDDFKKVLKEHPPLNGVQITTFTKCDFRPMFEYFEAEKAKKKAMTAQEKKDAKKVKEEQENKYMYCLLDGRKEKVGNFRVEPPGLFRGRGDHPKKGALKFRVRPEDITINIGADAPTPIPNVPGTWKHVQHDKTVTWLANWTENVNGNHKYVFLAAGSSLKGQSDMMKFEKARELKKHVDRIRKNYQTDLKSKVMADRQRATTMYFIDKLALRAGNEKGEDEADTVGCCSLRCEHVTLEAPDSIVFDFLGKDSIRYYNKVQVDAQVFKNVRIFKENKNDDDNLFDRVTTTSLNKHLTSEMKGLTAKVFRTFNASITFQRLLDEENLEGATLQEKLNAYNKANRWVAILCNHQRAAPKTHEQSMEKMRNRHRALKYERMKLRHALFATEPKFKKNKKYVDDESDLDEDWIAEHEEELQAKEIQKVEKKFAKDNEKLAEEGKQAQDDSVLKQKIKAIKEDFKQLAKERGTKKAALKRERPVEKLEEAIDKLTDKIKAFKLQMDDREEGKEVALSTSKINYLDPRITAAWCKTHDVPVEKLFSKTLLTKFPWAMEVESDWKF